MTWQVRIKGPRHLAASGLGRSDGTVDPGPLRDAIHPPVDGDRQEVLKVGEVRDGEESYLDGEELGELYLLLLLDDAGPSPVDVDRQEVLEDGEVYDQDESYQGDEDLDSFTPPSSSSMVPVPEVSTSWGSSFHAFSTSSSYRPLSPSFVVRSSGAMRPLLRLLLPSRSRSPFALLRLLGVVKKDLINAQHHTSSSGAAVHTVAARLDARWSALALPDTSPEDREGAAPCVRFCTGLSSVLRDTSRLLAASYTHGLSVAWMGARESASYRLMSILRDSLPLGGVFLRQPREDGPLIRKVFCRLKRPLPRLRIPRPLGLHVASFSARRPHVVLPLLALDRPLRISSCFLRFFVGVFPAPSIGEGEKTDFADSSTCGGSGRFPVDVGHCSRPRHPPPLTLPSPASFSNASRPDHVTLFDVDVEALQVERAIVEVSPPSPGFFARPFLVPKPVGRRPIIDLKRLISLFVICPRFRIDTLRVFSLLLQPGCWAASIDLEDAYLPVISPLPPLRLARPDLAVLRPSLRSVPRSTHLHGSDKVAKALLLLRGIRSVGGWTTFLSWGRPRKSALRSSRWRCVSSGASGS